MIFAYPIWSKRSREVGEPLSVLAALDCGTLPSLYRADSSPFL